MPTCRTPEGALTDGIFNRLTSRTNGITKEAPEGYCAVKGGVQKWSGQVEINAENLSQWGRAGVANGPVILIVVGAEVQYTTDMYETALGEYMISLFIACANYRSAYEAAGGGEAGRLRAPGIFKVKQDVLDRILNHGVVRTDVQDSSGNYVWEQPCWVESGRILQLQQNFCLYELMLRARIARIHGLVAYADLDTATGVDLTITKEPSTPGDEFEVGVQADIP